MKTRTEAQKTFLQVKINSALIIFVGVVMFMFMGYKFRAIAKIETEVRITKALTEHTEKLLIESMSRAVDRWEELRRDNPQVDVPTSKEPPITPMITPGGKNKLP